METELHAAIDIGTNTVLLLVVSVNGKGLEPLREEQRIPRLGKGVDASGNLSEASMDRVIEALKEYSRILNTEFPNVKTLSVTATSAVRDAKNGPEFVKEIKKKTGFEVVILSGLDEARYTYAGAMSMLPELTNAAVIDIGGGSTEIAIGENKKLLDSHSFDMGSVRFTERFLAEDIPSEKEIAICRSAIRKILEERDFIIDLPKADYTFIGVAGTVTSLAYMDMGLDSYETKKINGYVLSHQDLNKWIAIISEKISQELIEEYPSVMKGRAEVILAGLLILDESMNYYEISNLSVSTGGIRHGVIMEKAASNTY